MKKLLLATGIFFLFTGCNPKNDNATDSGPDKMTAADSKTAKPEYPYSLEKSYKNWQPGNQEHVVTVMKMIKAWETKNLEEAVQQFGDSAEIILDMYHKILPHDSILPLLKSSWENMTSVKITMQDWVSVISEDKNDEWVTLWYKQVLTDSKGKMDSMNIVDDAKIINGKIAIFDEKVQHFPTAKK